MDECEKCESRPTRMHDSMSKQANVKSAEPTTLVARAAVRLETLTKKLDENTVPILRDTFATVLDQSKPPCTNNPDPSCEKMEQGSELGQFLTVQCGRLTASIRQLEDIIKEADL